MPVKTEGFDTLARTLHRAGEDLAELPKAERATADLIAQTARALAPKLTGRLSASIESEVASGSVVVGSPLVYAPVIHNGWPRHGITATPYLTDAAESTQARWVGYYGDAVQDVADKIKGI